MLGGLGTAGGAKASCYDGDLVRVALVDDHPVILEMLEQWLVLAGGFAVVGKALDGATALQLVSERQPQVVVLDVGLPDLSGVDVARRIRLGAPDVAIVVFTGYYHDALSHTLRQLGVRAYLSKTTPGTEWIAVLRAVAHEGSFRTGTGLGAERTPSLQRLSAREVDILQWLAHGRTNAEIAATLGIAPKTVETHVTHILTKLGAQNRTEAVWKAHRQGLIALAG